MNLPEGHFPVLIVGAGPSGLMMAAQLLRYGVQPLIIDRKKGPTDQSKALAVQARSLEIYRQMGLADQALQQGITVENVSVIKNDDQLLHFSLKTAGGGKTEFPYVLMLEQSKNERLLLDFLTKNCCPVYWNTNLTDLAQTGNQTKATLKSDDKNSIVTTDWLIGADGATSTVRKVLKIDFKGDKYAHKFYVADLDFDQYFADNQVTLKLADASFIALFPMKGENRFRMITRLPPELEDREDVQFKNIETTLQQSLPAGLTIKTCHDFSVYKLYHRMAATFRHKNSFLIGDAAHVHSPVGGQGMNTGLQDAYNLAWKLAGVINHQLKTEILESFAAERMPVAQKLLQTTDRVFNFINAENLFIKIGRNLFLPTLMRFFSGKQNLQDFAFKSVSQIGIAYRDSKINLHLSKAEKVKAGDRLPFLSVFDEKKQQQTDLHAWCNKPGFTFIAMGKLADNDLFNLAKWITINYPKQLNFFYLPFSAKNKAVFDCFEMKENQHKTVIVRPDMYIGYLNDSIHVDLIDDYLEKVAGCINFTRKG